MDFLNGIVGTLGNIGGAIINGIVGAGEIIGKIFNPGVSGLFNFFNQNRAFDTQNSLNQQQMNREDSAFQRKVADLTAAGLSPALALGGGLPTSALRVGNPPEIQNIAQLYNDYQISQNNIATSKANSIISAIHSDRDWETTT